MFEDYDNDIVGFTSSILEPRELRDNSCQSNTTNVNVEVQVTTQTEKNIQTDNQQNNPQHVNYRNEDLLAFLQRCCAIMEEEINIKTEHFLFEDEHEDLDQASATKLQSFQNNTNDRKVSCFAWSKDGGKLAVAFSAANHENWCNHEGNNILLYNMMVIRQWPPRALTTMSCVSTMKFHPRESSILAAGLYNGEVIVWDLAKPDNHDIVKNAGHNASVKCMIWHVEAMEAPCLITGGADGRLLCWKTGVASCQIEKRYKVPRDYLPKTYQSLRDFGLEITTIDHCGKRDEGFVISAGGKNLFHIQLLKPGPDNGDPVVLKYESHTALITSVEAHVNQRLFASASIDGEIRIYRFMEPDCKYAIQTSMPQVGVFWSTMPSCVCSYGGSNKLSFYIITNRRKTDFFVATSLTGDITAVQLFSNRRNIAIGDSHGNTEIWLLPETYL